MATLHLGTQGLQRTELKLFDGAFGFFQPGGNFADGALLDKTLMNDAALDGGKPVYEAKKAGVVFDGFEFEGGKVLRDGRLRGISGGWLFARGALVLISESVGGNAEKPRSEWNATPFISGKIGERFVKNFRSEIFGSGAIADARNEEVIDPLEIELIQGSEPRGVALSGLDEKTLIRALRGRFLCRTSDGHHVSCL